MLGIVLLLASAAVTNGQGLSSCVGRCDDYVDHSYTCQCNSYCTSYGDCCTDYHLVCLNSPELTCAGRCDTGLDNSKPCQCNSYCLDYGDCCPDYNTLCNSPDGGSSGGTGTCSPLSVSNAELLEVSRELWRLDVNRAQDYEVVVNEQSTTSDSSTVDKASEPFFTYVDPAVLQRPTFMALQALQDNYQKLQGIDESVTTDEEVEQDHFLDLMFETSVGQYLFDFLSSKNMAGCGDLALFKSYMKKMWFDLYSRQNGAMDTSGFEHVFVGEIKTDYVSGFHNWVQFYNQEVSGDVNYYGYVSMSEPDLWGNHFTWDGYMKGLGGTAVGASPEVELAIFTLCHMARPDSICNVGLVDSDNSDVTRQIQTWTWSKTTPGSGLKYVASAYFKV